MFSALRRIVAPSSVPSHDRSEKAMGMPLGFIMRSCCGRSGRAEQRSAAHVRFRFRRNAASKPVRLAVWTRGRACAGSSRCT